MSTSAEDVTKKIAQAKLASVMETEQPASDTPPPASDALEIPEFLDRRPKRQPAKRKTAVSATSYEDYAKLWPSVRTPRDATKDTTSHKLVALAEDIQIKGNQAHIKGQTWKAAVDLMTNDFGDMAEAFSLVWKSERAPDRLRTLIREFLVENMRYRTPSKPIDIVVKD